MSPENSVINKKIAVFFFENNRDINSYPYILNVVDTFVKHSYQVDIYINSSITFSEKIQGANLITLAGETFSDYVFNAVDHLKDNSLEYGCFFAYTFEGIVISYLLNKAKKIPTPAVYFSLELIYNNFFLKTIIKFLLSLAGKLLSAFNFDHYLLKKLSFYNKNRRYYMSALEVYAKIEFFKNNSFIIASVIQDELRGAILKQEFNFTKDKDIYYIPNSYIGFTGQSSNYASRKFNIPESKKIILYSGALFLGSEENELFELSNKIGDEYVLFFNIYGDEKIIKKAREDYRGQIENHKLYINTANLNIAEYDELVKSSHICIAWYKNVGAECKNIYYMGLSSGKLTKYLSCGKPVIAPEYIYGYKKMIEENFIGAAPASVDEINNSLEMIELNYLKIKKNVENFYKEKLDCAVFLNDFYLKLENKLENFYSRSEK
ncbi:MAG: glycosyltransferase [uncultured bacterium]|nr:MAG: glycosyltransferase [uncultured bacterium]